MPQPVTIDPADFGKRLSAVRRNNRHLTVEAKPAPFVGVTVASPSYWEMAREAVERFQKFTGAPVVVICPEVESFTAKLCLDELIAPQAIVYFDADWWMLRDYDFNVPLSTGHFWATRDPGATNPGAFPCIDSIEVGWNPENYFNSGLFVCDLRLAYVRQIFRTARHKLADAHNGEGHVPVDWTDQFFLNAGLFDAFPKAFRALPVELNFWKVAFDWGNVVNIPRQIVGLHAAGVPLVRKLDVLRAQAAVFGGGGP